MTSYFKNLKSFFVQINNNGIKYFLPKFFFGYCISGLSSVAVLLFVQSILINIFYIQFSLSQLISTVFALFTSFLLNNYFTFSYINNISKSVKRKLIQYFITNVFTILMNVLIASIIFSKTSNWLISSLTGISSAIVFNFIIYRFKIWSKS
jgi:putative flippase GtrA